MASCSYTAQLQLITLFSPISISHREFSSSNSLFFTPLDSSHYCKMKRGKSPFVNLQYKSSKFKLPTVYRIERCSSCQVYSNSIRNDYPQNADLPRYYSKREKKPFPIPIVELRRAARERLKNSKGKPKLPTLPPRNGMLVKNLIPVAYEVINTRAMLINNLKKLLKVVPVQACKHCNEIHVGATGHPFRTCRGLRAEVRRGSHEWTSTVSIDDILTPMESFHLYDRLGKRIPHHLRFTTPRVPSLVELCVQAGVDLPEHPTKRRRKPVIRLGRSEIVDANEDDLPEDFDPYSKYKKPLIHETLDTEVVETLEREEVKALCEETLEVWDALREGTGRLMRRYAVRVCGYCPEVHVGPSGHKAQNCGAHKHQQRNGQHGWQTAVLDDLLPPRYVWHVPRDGGDGVLKRELRSFYGQAPAVVEICVQGGGEVPEKYRGTMRLDVGIPASLSEADMVV